MAADDFELKPTWVMPEAQEFHNIVTQSETMKKEYFNISANGVEKFKLKYEGLSDTDFKVLFDHYNERYGGYDLFDWMNAYIPAEIKTLLGVTSENLSGRWVDGSFKFNPKPKSWTAEITFERNI